MSDVEAFEAAADAPAEGGDAPFLLDIAGFEGPIDLLLTLAREQKVDLTRISILELADQYLLFVAEARKLRLELAADYLVMAAWLAYLKSRLLIPEPEGEEPSGEELAAALQFQLQRLEAMREAGVRLLALPQLGRDVFRRGSPEPVQINEKTIHQVTLYDLLKAYGEHQRRTKDPGPYMIMPLELHSIEEALERLQSLLGRLPSWTTLSAFLPADLGEGIVGRSAVAATLIAALELVKSGQAEMRQATTFGPIHIRPRRQEISQ